MSGTLYAASQKVLHKRAQDGPHANWTVARDPMKDTARLDTYAVGVEVSNTGWIRRGEFPE